MIHFQISELLKPMENGERDTELTREERNILSNVYDFIVGKRPQYRSILKSVEQKEEQNVDDQNPEMDMIKYISQKVGLPVHWDIYASHFQNMDWCCTCLSANFVFPKNSHCIYPVMIFSPKCAKYCYRDVVF